MRLKLLYKAAGLLFMGVMACAGCKPEGPDGGTTTTTVPLVDGMPPPAKDSITFGERYGDLELLTDRYRLEVIVPPAQTLPAPFDAAILPDGRIVMCGVDDHLVSVGAGGVIDQTDYPCGMNFEPDAQGVMWYYNWVGGELSYFNPSEGETVSAADLDPVYTDGSIAAAPDGSAVYVGWWKIDEALNIRSSVLYRYTGSQGLETVLEANGKNLLRAVEVTADGTVYVGREQGVYRLAGGSRLEAVCYDPGLYIESDGLTSDEQGNLYFTAEGQATGLYRLEPGSTPELIASLDRQTNLAYGLSWDSISRRVVGVHKESGSLLAISLAGDIEVLNNPTGFTTPIAVAEHPSGTIFANGDEAGLLMVDGSGSVLRYKSGIVSYQPPAADFAFEGSGLIYYSVAAPGFTSMIITIASDGSVEEITKEVGAPAGIDIGSDGSVCYADYQNGAVMKLAGDGTSTTVQSGIPFPVGLVVDSTGTFYVGAAEQGAEGDPNALNEVYNTRILRFTEAQPVEEIISLGEGHAFTFFDVDAQGNLYLPDCNELLLYAPDGSLTTIARGFKCVRGATVARDGRIYITDYGSAALYRLVAAEE